VTLDQQSVRRPRRIARCRRRRLPGPSNPTAGDIAIADGHGAFYNGGMMAYSGRAGWNASPRAKLLGGYVPR